MKQLLGYHHVTAMTSNAEKIFYFFTTILGMRLVKKTINQDDIHTYHLFFADQVGSPGTDMTFFDFPNIQKAIKGSNSIALTSFRVANDAAIDYWKKRFTAYGVEMKEEEIRFGRRWLPFVDFDHQEYALISDERTKTNTSFVPWSESLVPKEASIVGLGPVVLRVQQKNRLEELLNSIYQMRSLATEKHQTWMEMKDNGNHTGIILDDTPTDTIAQMGYGGVHHVAFRVPDTITLEEWLAHYQKQRLPNSGIVDRFYFQSLYARVHPGILFELATDGPGFIDDEENEAALGSRLALPPRFRGMRTQIESIVRPIQTTFENKEQMKEYF